MIANIDFSLFRSPTKAYGSVNGNIQLDSTVQEGDEVRILREVEGDWFSGTLKIISISRMQDGDRLFVGLQDVVAQTSEDAARLCSRFEKEAGLFCDLYE